jgi:pimeloyl-ACP methyl ester carboxylesterase
MTGYLSQKGQQPGLSVGPWSSDPAERKEPVMRIVLAHGAWADGSSWAAVIRRLQAAGHAVVAPQLPHTSLADSVAKLRHVLSLQAEPTLLVGHSFGGQVMTALGTDAPNVVGLVYVAGFGLDEGESIGALLNQGPPTPAVEHLSVDDRGFAWLPEDAFLKYFAPDVDPDEARVMCAVQQPLPLATLEDVISAPAWKHWPTWFAVAQHDQVIPPDAERSFAQRMRATTVEVDSSHVVMISHPDEITALILSAVESCQGSAGR